MNLAVIFGGRSAEHDISVITGLQAIANLKRDDRTVVPIYIDRKGAWYTGAALEKIDAVRACQKHGKACYLDPRPGVGLTVEGMFAKRTPLDVALLCMHGCHGEDGSLQGLLELCDVPYTSCGVGASAGGMDKVTMKHIFRGVGLPVLPDVSCTRDELANVDAVVARVENGVGYPCFVKPANLGSSIGIGRAADRAELEQALAVAASFDRRILIEKAVVDPREVNCSALGFGHDVQVSAIEEPLRAKDFLSFDDKYMSSGGQGGMKTLKRKLPADIPEATAAAVRDCTARCFTALDCKGVVRVDFLIDAQGELFINEVNTIPGSLAFYLWEPLGMDYPSLLEKLIEYAFVAHKEKQKNEYAYESKVLGQYGGAKTK